MSVQIDSPAPGIARIRIDRPEARNAINDAVRAGLLPALEQVRDDPSVRALVIGGTGGVFCAGGDLPSLAGLSEDAAYARLRDGHRIASLVWSFPKPVVSAVERFAVGAGAGLALLADEIVMGEGAMLSFPFAKLGLLMDWGLAGTLPRRIGPEATTRLYAMAATLKGPQALELGLADRLAKDDAVMDAALDRAIELAKVAPAAFASAKARQRGDAEEALQLDREAREQAACIVSPAFAEGYAAFREKREPRF
ncbi:enoyl-CoA hydratase/isomerase family protein [Sphingomonas sp. AOB5]|uniref:enoyl-CoA hydratase/isomerase family protein n=1 Tax=Sphingomonas sp. AOB5 TaxID=3034017 RepID=UPI0023FA1788|nr:enoyl-CoA hydratase/isomerase family protein [Sphingomonas sp. AOB5]MDF7774777.1 enoyl-CoA hydratase/isomerase family protein [Sphingomonas sp. AOB5]